MTNKKTTPPPKRLSRQTDSAAADEVDDLELVVLLDEGGGPAASRGDLAVMLYGNAVRLEGEGFEEFWQRRGCAEIGKAAGLAVELDGKWHLKYQCSVSTAQRLPE